MPLVHALRVAGGRETEAAELCTALALNLAREAALLLPLLRSGLVGALALAVSPRVPKAVLCAALDVLDVLAHNALSWVDVNADRVEDTGGCCDCE